MKEYEDKVLSRLDALLSVRLTKGIQEGQMIDKVRVLKNAGLDYKEIAKILNTTPNSVSVMFAKLNKEARKKDENGPKTI